MTLGEHEVDYVWVSNFYGVEIDPTVDFQLSSAPTISSRRSPPGCASTGRSSTRMGLLLPYSNLHRLHVLFGESNMSEYARC